MARMNLQKLNRTIGFNWVDKLGLGLAVAVLALFFRDVVDTAPSSRLGTYRTLTSL
jgi:hypothetical protein